MYKGKFILSMMITIFFIIAVSVAAYTPDTAGSEKDNYVKATAVFAVAGVVGSALLTFLLFKEPASATWASDKTANLIASAKKLI